MTAKRVVLVGFVVLALTVAARADVVASKVTVTTAATVLASASATVGRQYVEVSHACAASIYVGGSAVTTVTGREITTGQSLSITLLAGEALYGIVASSTCSVSVLRSGGS